MKPIGYAWLVHQYHLAVIPNWHESALSSGAASRTDLPGGKVEEEYTAAYEPAETFGAQLEFALKYDGTNLLILAKLFAILSPDEIAEYVRSKPTGKYARRIWYLYELLTKTRLPLSDLTQGNYVDLLDPEEYYTTRGVAVQRQRIRDNLLGDANFCPTIRRTIILKEFELSNLGDRCLKIMSDNPPELLKRALGYLYTKETKSSFEIEHIAPDATRMERFVSLLQSAEEDDFVLKQSLIDLQNQIVDDRYRDNDYRITQNYVGETVLWKEKVHFVAPKPEDLPELMNGLINSHNRIDNSIHPILHAAIIAYAFVYMHPFEDGNGRIHRFLIHNILSRRGFTPKGIMFPVSAVMLKRLDAYNVSLEEFSRPLLPLISYSLDEHGQMSVQSETADFYRYIDFTSQSEALFRFVRETIDVELVDGLQFLVNYDNTKREIQEIVDMPDRLIDLFIKFCFQNNGKLSNSKRENYFAKLTDQEITKMEEAVRQGYNPEGP